MRLVWGEVMFIYATACKPIFLEGINNMSLKAGGYNITLLANKHWYQDLVFLEQRYWLILLERFEAKFNTVFHNVFNFYVKVMYLTKNVNLEI